MPQDVATPTVAAPTAAPRPVPHDKVLIIFSGLLLAMLLAALDSTIVATALPTIVGELGGLAHLSWVVTAYLLAQTVVTPLYGKLGDLYGRKGVLQSSIILFLIGSALCGISQNMTELIVFRFVQGLGGGGLTVTTQAVVGDIVSPRERGRYQGIFGAGFGLASIAGPLLGGYFTSHLSWRWIFYVNLPLGIVAMVVIAAVLPATGERVRRSIDYAGAALLAIALSAIILLSDVGGTNYAWTSPFVLGLIGVSVLGTAAFLFAEQRAQEPVLPLRLFRNEIFSVTNAIGLIVGFALFGSVTYLPLYLQIVKGATPTASGLQMLPMMAGMLVTSIASGLLISRRGRYKLFPIIGTAVMAFGLFLLSRMTMNTGIVTASFIMLALGLGLGMVMQVLVIAVQNAVDYADLGVATSGATLFRLIGGSLGTAVLGAIFASRLGATLARTLPAGAAGSTAANGIDPQRLAQMPAALREIYAHAFTTSLSTVFVVATAIALVAFVLAVILPDRQLRETVAARSGEAGHDVGEAFAMPGQRESLQYLQRGLSVLADRDVQRRHIEQIVARAGLDLSPAAAWLLVQIDRNPRADVNALARQYGLDASRLQQGLEQLRSRGLVRQLAAPSAVGTELGLTSAGCDTLDRLIAARRERLAELLSEWPPESHEKVGQLLVQLARELVPARSPVSGSPAV